jgi:low temperature requirement protein LtrA
MTRTDSLVANSAFKSKKDGHSHVYLIWYVVAVLETAFNIAVSSRWKVMSFKGTHLVQRMSLLTLIICKELSLS